LIDMFRASAWQGGSADMTDFFHFNLVF